MKERILFSVCARSVCATRVVVAAAFALTTIAGSSAEAQTFKVLYAFTGGANSALPIAGVTLDKDGNIYGTTENGGTAGTVFELKRNDSAYAYKELHNFTGAPDGGDPWAGVAIGANGVVYGATLEGGRPAGYGTVYTLTPPAKNCSSPCVWKEDILYRFTNGSDGRDPYAGVVLDEAGNVYGSTANGGGGGVGAAFELSPVEGGGWNFQVIHTFSQWQDGASPIDSLIFDSAGNLYGTGSFGGLPGCGNLGCGTVFELTPSSAGWTGTAIYEFPNGKDGGQPAAGLVMDSAGNLYGVTQGYSVAGAVFTMTPSQGGWTYDLDYDLHNGAGPTHALARDQAGNLYGTTFFGGKYNKGVVFELSPTSNGWVYRNIHDFNGDDGENPSGGIVIDGSGNLFGTAYEGGAHGCGTVFEITP